MPEDSLLPPPESAGLPWSRLKEAGWRIKHMGHDNGTRLLVVLKKDEEILNISGPDTPELWTRLEVKAGIEKRSAIPKKEKQQADPRHKEFIEAWDTAYRAHFQRRYIFNGAVDASQLSRFLKSTEINVSQMIDVARDAWSTADTAKFAQATKRASTIAGFCTSWNDINAEINRLNPKTTQDTSHVL